MLLEGQIECRNLECRTEGFYPSWEDTTFASKNPQRDNNPAVGTLHASTCPSCGEIHLALTTADHDPEGVREYILFPPGEEAIDFIVVIFVQFVNEKRRENGEEPMSDEEEKQATGRWKSFLSGMWETAKGAKTVSEVMELAKEATKLLS